MIQEQLFHESPEDALTAVVIAAGGYKAVGHRMRPELPADQAGNWLRDCLSGSRREKLSPSQILMLLVEGRRVSCHAAMYFIARAGGYADPLPIEPDDERAALQRQFAESVALQRAIVTRMERLVQSSSSITPLRSA